MTVEELMDILKGMPSHAEVIIIDDHDLTYSIIDIDTDNQVVMVEVERT
jgi:hypothetical protein